MEDKEYYIHRHTQSIVHLLDISGPLGRESYRAEYMTAARGVPIFTVDNQQAYVFHLCWRRISKLEVALRGIKL